MKAWTELIARLDAAGLRRRLAPLRSSSGPWVERDGRRLLNLASNDYLGLAADPRLAAAAAAALTRWGTGAGGSRLLGGDREIHGRLEAELAELKGTEAALLHTSGYAANVGLIPALCGRGDHVFSDRLNHASLIDGIRLSGAQAHVFRHRDPGHLEELLLKAPAHGQRVVVSDAVFSMDGVVAPLAALVEVSERHGALLVVDDAHGTGVAGPEGRGTVQHLGLGGRVPVQMATLSKAFGVQGGFVAGSQVLVEVLIHRSRSFVYSTGMAPALAAAALEAVRLARSEEWRRERLRRHLDRLVEGLKAKGYRVVHEPPAPMLVVMVGEAAPALDLARRLEAAGVLAPAIRPPTVPEGTSRLRLAPMATHSDADVDLALEAFPPFEELPGGSP